ncbi:hypothetical protein BJ875DRAFT_78403 [Amylocarpus encephaloides]|uniref:Peptidase S8/S53 domain-containing protein n=1 Tax=Amylocarpus encephaloides TaxID=45428 RepID=A0A9P8C3U0_9HELO|nr:hypothetical protein BJ875DRAFT_78403 [Amylocarpus encephaloides]
MGSLTIVRLPQRTPTPEEEEERKKDPLKPELGMATGSLEDGLLQISEIIHENNNGPDCVINLSLGSNYPAPRIVAGDPKWTTLPTTPDHPFRALYAVLQELLIAGVSIVVAAGSERGQYAVNSGFGADDKLLRSIPSIWSSEDLPLIVVGAAEMDGERASYQPYKANPPFWPSASVDVYAPTGVGVTCEGGDAAVNRYTFGSSIATATVSGLLLYFKGTSGHRTRVKELLGAQNGSPKDWVKLWKQYVVGKAWQRETIWNVINSPEHHVKMIYNNEVPLTGPTEFACPAVPPFKRQQPGGAEHPACTLPEKSTSPHDGLAIASAAAASASSVAFNRSMGSVQSATSKASATSHNISSLAASLSKASLSSSLSATSSRSEESKMLTQSKASNASSASVASVRSGASKVSAQSKASNASSASVASVRSGASKVSAQSKASNASSASVASVRSGASKVSAQSKASIGSAHSKASIASVASEVSKQSAQRQSSAASVKSLSSRASVALTGLGAFASAIGTGKTASMTSSASESAASIENASFLGLLSAMSSGIAAASQSSVSAAKSLDNKKSIDPEKVVEKGTKPKIVVPPTPPPANSPSKVPRHAICKLERHDFDGKINTFIRIFSDHLMFERPVKQWAIFSACENHYEQGEGIADIIQGHGAEQKESPFKDVTYQTLKRDAFKGTWYYGIHLNELILAPDKRFDCYNNWIFEKMGNDQTLIDFDKCGTQ